MKEVVTLGAICLSSCVAAIGQPAEVVTFKSEDGVYLVADYYPPPAAGSPVVILLHMYRSDRSSWKPLVPALRKAGFAVLALDMRGHGGSVRPASMNLIKGVLGRDEALFREMHRDVAAGYVFLSRQGKVDMSRVALIGASVGCSVAIDYAARDRSVDVVVCLTPGERYLGVDSRRHIKHYVQRPILLMATEDERAASDLLSKLNPAATVQIVGPGRVHGTQMFGVIGGVEKRIVSFIMEGVGTGEGRPVVATIDGDEYFAIGSKEHIETAQDRIRWFSSVQEARARGLSGPDSPYEGRLDDGMPGGSGDLPP